MGSFRTTAKRLSFFLTAFLFCVTFALSAPLSANAVSQRVRVGYFDYGEVIRNEGNGRYTGYIYEYLEAIAEYTGWGYDFIQVDIDTGLDMLEKGEIDLISGLNYSESRAEVFDYSSREYGYESALLTVLADNDAYYYEDFAAFDGIKVGMLADSHQNELFEEYARQHGFRYTKRYYYSDVEMERALDSGEVDALLSGSLRVSRKEKCVAEFGSVPHYIAATKGSGLMAKLDEAAEEMARAEPTRAGELYNKYYGRDRMPYTAFTREEQEYIDSLPDLKVVYAPLWRSIEYIGGGEFLGAGADIIQQISDLSGLTFEFIRADSFDEGVQMLQAGQADLLCGSSKYERQTGGGSLRMSEPYLDIPLSLFCLRGSELPEQLRIGIIQDSGGLGKQIMQEYPTAQVRAYDSAQSCMQALKQGEVDALFGTTYILEGWLDYEDVMQLERASLISATHSLCFAVSEQMPETLVSILNKTIARIPDQEKSDILFANTIRLGGAYRAEVWSSISWGLIAGVVVLLVGWTILLVFSRRSRKQLQKYAFTDPLTGARNWTKFEIDARKLLETNSEIRYAVLQFDINKFKAINDMHGFQTGDMILRFVTRIFNEYLEPNELFCRESGDHFIVLMHCADEADMRDKVNFLMERLNDFPAMEGKQVRYTVCCGIDYIDPQDRSNIRLIADNANLARRSIKNDAIRQYAFYTQSMRDIILYEKDIENHMEAALINNEFVVYYQPKYRLDNGMVTGAEALVRWNRPGKGMVPPDRFIPVFESNGFIVQLDLYVFEQVCRRIRSWIEAGVMPIAVSVNISRVHLYRFDFYNDYIKIMQKYEIPPQLIELELTENAFFENQDRLIFLMHTLHEKGFAVSMDDFGSGYSSLNLLKDMPIDVLKIDREFFNVSTNSRRGQRIIANIVRMAKELNISVVSEGVETQEQADFLRRIHCDTAQGYYFSRPLPVEELERVVYPYRFGTNAELPK